MALYLWPEIQRTMDDLHAENEAFREAGNARVKAENAYKRAKALAIIRAHDEDGYPWSVADKVAYAYDDVSQAHDVLGYAEVAEKASQEKINELKHRLVTLRDQFAREWAQAGRDY